MSFDPDHNDPDKFGDRGRYSGHLPDLTDPDEPHHAEAIYRLFGRFIGDLIEPSDPTSSLEAKATVRAAMEVLSGPERVALACAPKPEPLTPDELDHWSRVLAEEAYCEGRHHRPFPVNPHD